MDSSTTFVQAGTLPKPRVVGRTVRLLLGLVCCYTALKYAGIPDVLLRLDFSRLFLLTGPAFALWLLPPVVNLGFGRSWKHWSRTVVLLLCAGAILVDLLVYGQIWGPPLGAVIYAVTVYTFAHLGLSFVLATVLATPGCEMRAIPDLIGRLTGRMAQEHHCPGFITPLDNSEARLHQACQL